MTDDQRNVDMMLATGAARMLRAGETMQQMRTLQRDSSAGELYWYRAQQLADDLHVACHCLTEANRIMLAKMGLAGVAEGFEKLLGGGLVN